MWYNQEKHERLTFGETGLLKKFLLRRHVTVSVANRVRFHQLLRQEMGNVALSLWKESAVLQDPSAGSEYY